MKAKEGDSNPLLISFRKPYKPVSSATIARWMKEVMRMAGIDITQFSAHSTRSASVTAARSQGTSIMSMAGWSRLSTFETFYHKPPTSDFSLTVLGGKKGISLNNTLSYMQPCHDMELKISQGLII